jgi:PEP-CTERM motif
MMAAGYILNNTKQKPGGPQCSEQRDFYSPPLCYTLLRTPRSLYDFSGRVNFIGAVELFRYTAPAFITADAFIPASALDLCSTGQMLPCFGVNFLPSGPDTPQHYPELTFQTRNPDNSVGIVFYYFPLGSSFAAYGTLTNAPSLGNAGTVTVSAVPEPSTALTLSIGLLGVVAAFRKKCFA